MATSTVRQALEYIQEHDWVKGKLYGEDGEVCIWGSILKTGATPAEQKAARRYIEDAIEFLYPLDPRRIESFNDQERRVIEDVFLVMKHAASIQEEMQERLGDVISAARRKVAERKARG